jgi:GH15 family glucan-1,4-alpha-glucosidase
MADRRHRRGADHLAAGTQIGGVRNWDYRFCWLRDATFTILSLLNAGYRQEAEAWADWLLRAIAGRARAGPAALRRGGRATHARA